MFYITNGKDIKIVLDNEVGDFVIIDNESFAVINFSDKTIYDNGNKTFIIDDTNHSGVDELGNFYFIINKAPTPYYYILQENEDKITLENDNGFILTQR